MADDRLDLPQGTFDLLTLETLSLESRRGQATTERLRQVPKTVLENQLFGVSARDLPTYAAASSFIGVVAAALASGPIRRLCSTSPHAALETE